MLLLFLIVSILLTCKIRILQVRGFFRFWHLLTAGIPEKSNNYRVKAISPIQALFTAMSTSIGMGNIISPAMAIGLGGPGALFWLLLYIFLGSATKFVEVSFALYTRTTGQAGTIIGGPGQYLRLISPRLGTWYAALTVLLFTGWSSLQVNTLASIWQQEGIYSWVTGLIIVTILLIIVYGGISRISLVVSRIIPIAFLLYTCFALLILYNNIHLLVEVFKLIITAAFSSHAASGALAGITIFSAMRHGIYQSVFITESGLGTSAISHAQSDVKKPVDQAILAMFSGLANIFLCTLSGLLALVTGVWQSGKLSNTLMYEAFKNHAPFAGAQWVLVVSVLLFVLTALLGNMFNGSQNFAVFTRGKYINLYYISAALIAFCGALIDVPLIWNIMDVFLVLVAIPNLLGILYLAFKYPTVIKD